MIRSPSGRSPRAARTASRSRWYSTSPSSPSRKSVLGYDAVGRPTSLKTYQGASTLRLEWTTTYLGDGAIASVAFDGTGSSPSQGIDTISYTYDALGRPDQTKRGSTVLTDNAWNPDDTLASRADGSAGTSSFSYDWADRQISATSPIATGTVTTTYRLDGLVGTRILGNGETATLAYDPAKRPTQITLTTGGTISQAYDRRGNVTSESRSLTGISGNAGTGTQSFSYDALRRVTKATIPGTNTACGQSGVACYSYDRNGNRLTKQVGANTTAYVYDWTDELASQSVNGGASMSFTYDAYGNQTGARDSAGGLTTSAYDWADRLTSVTPPGGPATSYTLDALGRPWTRTTGASVDTYAYLGSTTTAWQIANAGGGGTTTSSALDATGARTAIAGASLTGYLAFDLHGNLVAAESGSKVVTDALRYDAWGEVLASSTSALPTPWRYQGRLDLSPDAANPLYDYGARAYRPVQGAFTSLDTYAGTVIDPLSMNRFLYAEANPTTLIDPDGHRACMDVDGTCVPSAEADAVWEENKQQAQAVEERHIDAINTTACQRTGVCSVAITGSPGPQAPPTEMRCALTLRDSGLTQGPDCLAWVGGPPTTTEMPDQTFFWINTWIGTLESASGTSADAMARRAAASAAMAASINPMVSGGQGAWSWRSSWEGSTAKLAKTFSRGIVGVGLLVTAVDSVSTETQQGSVRGRSGPEIALRSVGRFLFSAGGSLGAGSLGAVGGFFLAGPPGAFAGGLGAGTAGGLVGNEAFTLIFGE